MKKRLCALCILVFSVWTPQSHAVLVTTSGNFKTDPAGTPTLSIVTDITFMITSNGAVTAFVFDEWVTGDGSVTDVDDSPISQSVTYSLNGLPNTTIAIGGLVDNNPVGGLTANDGYLAVQFTLSIPVNTNDVLTLRSGTFTFESNASFNQPPASFSGDMFVAGFMGVKLSGPGVAVPEASAALCVGIACVGTVLSSWGINKRRASSRARGRPTKANP